MVVTRRWAGEATLSTLPACGGNFGSSLFHVGVSKSGTSKCDPRAKNTKKGQVNPKVAKPSACFARKEHRITDIWVGAKIFVHGFVSRCRKGGVISGRVRTKSENANQTKSGGYCIDSRADSFAHVGIEVSLL